MMHRVDVHLCAISSRRMFSCLTETLAVNLKKHQPCASKTCFPLSQFSSGQTTNSLCLPHHAHATLQTTSASCKLHPNSEQPKNYLLSVHLPRPPPGPPPGAPDKTHTTTTKYQPNQNATVQSIIQTRIHLPPMLCVLSGPVEIPVHS